jgi:hypothetical protein
LSSRAPGDAPELVSGALVDVPAGYCAGGWGIETEIASGSWASIYAARRIAPPSAPDDPPRDACGALKFLLRATLSPAQRADLQEPSARRCASTSRPTARG